MPIHRKILWFFIHIKKIYFSKTAYLLFNKANKCLTDIGFRHIWDNQCTLSRVALLKSIQNKRREI